MFSLNRFCIFETTIILLLGYFSESCKFISILFVLCNQFSILTFVALFIDLMQDDALTLSRCSCIGPCASGAPRHGVGGDCSVLPDTPCA